MSILVDDNAASKNFQRVESGSICPVDVQYTKCMREKRKTGILSAMMKTNAIYE
jgi:hypothetical protein